jgi:predicted phosphodiesterase
LTRRLEVRWPDPRPFRDRGGRPIRILAASDEPDPALELAANREALGTIDLVIGCGDLAPDRLCFLADAFRAPLVYVRGNHDRGGPWPRPRNIPEASVGSDERSLPGISMLALPWPTGDRDTNRRDDRDAWLQVVRLAGRRLLRSSGPCLVFSHVPPLNVGDTPTDHYHRGFAAYRFLLDRVAPPLWLHGHTTMAARETWQEQHGPTVLANVTGSILVELLPAATEAGSRSEPRAAA